MRSWPAVVVRPALVLALVVAAITAGPATAYGPTGPATTDGMSRTAAPADSMQFTVDVRAGGDAVWTVSTTVSVASESDRKAFRDLAATFERGETEVGFSVGAFRAAADAAQNATGREMEIRNVNRTATVRNETGYLVLEFRWTSFARVDGDRIHVGDAFNTTTGTWLPGLTRGQTLVVEPPAGYAVVSAPTGHQGGTFRWTGPTTFDPGQLSVTYERSDPPESRLFALLDDLGILPLVGGGLLLVAILVAGAYLLWRRDSTPGAATPAPTESDGDGRSGAVPAAPGDESAATDDAEAAGATDDELLADEERVERLLERNGGRMKQATIVTETGWSNAKVSQLLSEMADEDRVDKLRIGRENLISLPDEDDGQAE